MNIYVFSSKKDATKRKINLRWSKAEIKTKCIELAIQKFNELVLNGNNVYMLVKTNEGLYHHSKTMYDESNMNYFIIAMSLSSEGKLFDQSIVKDYVNIKNKFKEIEFSNNLKVLEQINYSVTNRVLTVFKISFLDNDNKKTRILFDTSDYLINKKGKEESDRFTLDLSNYKTVSLPRRISSYYNIKLEEKENEFSTNRPTVVVPQN